MAVANLITQNSDEHQFSFEVLPPLKGTGTERLFADIEKLCKLNPAFINITTHHSEFVYKELSDGRFERQRLRLRPGTIAVAAAIQQRFHVPVQPHVICSGASIEDIEYELLDLQFLGITDLLLLRGDKAKEDRVFKPTPGGHSHTTELIRQVQRFNEGFFANGEPIKNPGAKFDIGVACYPEKQILRFRRQGAPDGHHHSHHPRHQATGQAQPAVGGATHIPLRHSRGPGPRNREVQDRRRCTPSGHRMDRAAMS